MMFGQYFVSSLLSYGIPWRYNTGVKDLDGDKVDAQGLVKIRGTTQLRGAPLKKDLWHRITQS